MIILKEKQPFNEMAQVEVPGFGNEKYVIISKDVDHPPLHAYIYDQYGKELGDFLVTEQPPRKMGDVKPFRVKSIPSDAEAMIIEQARKPEPVAPKLNCWEYLVALSKTHLQKKFRK
jgi:hypothetical protein